MAHISTALAPIGVFDSGVGGLTVARAIIDQLPDEDIVYVGDTGNGPYGPLSIPEIRAHALAIGDDLVDRGVKALVIACNSASSACLHDARERYDVPVVEVIVPATRRAVGATRSGRVGVICTTATATSRAYDDAFAANPGIDLHVQACPRFVDFVESGVTGGSELLTAAEDVLPTLRDLTGESVQLYRREGDSRVCVAVAEPASGLRDTVPVGVRLPLTAGSGAKVLMAWSDEAPGAFDPDLLADAEREELVGRTVVLTNDGTANTATW